MLWIFVSNTIPPITISSSTWCTYEGVESVFDSITTRMRT
jgi:hypothetical protein